VREEKEHREVDPREPPALAPVDRATLAPVARRKKLASVARRKKLVAGWIRSPAPGGRSRAGVPTSRRRPQRGGFGEEIWGNLEEEV